MPARSSASTIRLIIYGLIILFVVGGYAFYDTARWKREMAARMRLGPDVAPHPYGPPTVPAVTGFTKADIPAAAAAYARFKVAQFSGDLATVQSMMIGHPGARRDIEMDMRESAAEKKLSVLQTRLMKVATMPERPAAESVAPHLRTLTYRVGQDIIVATNGSVYIGLRRLQGEWKLDMDYPYVWHRSSEDAEAQAKRVEALERCASDGESGRIETVAELLRRRRAAREGDRGE